MLEKFHEVAYMMCLQKKQKKKIFLSLAATNYKEKKNFLFPFFHGFHTVKLSCEGTFCRGNYLFFAGRKKKVNIRFKEKL